MSKYGPTTETAANGVKLLHMPSDSDMAHFGISSSEELRQVDRGAVIAYRRHLEELGTKASTVRRKLSALSSLFTHLVDRQVLREAIQNTQG